MPNSQILTSTFFYNTEPFLENIYLYQNDYFCKMVRKKCLESFHFEFRRIAIYFKFQETKEEQF